MRFAPLAMAVVILGTAAQADDADDSSTFLLTGASAGVSYDSNVTRTEAPQGGMSVDVSANAGGGWAPSEHWGLSALALYSGRVWTDEPTLSTHAVTALGLVTVSPVKWLALGLAPSAGYTLATDPARMGPRFDARGFVQWRPADWLSLRASYAYLLRDAADPVFATKTHEGAGRVRVEPFEWLNVSLSASVGFGNDFVYRETAGDPLATATSGRGAGRSSLSTNGTIFEPVPVDATTFTAALDVELVLKAGFSVSGGVAFIRSENVLQPWQSWVPSVLLAWDLP